MLLGRGTVAFAIFLALFVTFTASTEACTLMTSPNSFNLGDFLNLFIGDDCEQPNLKFDKKSERWVEECPDVSGCQFGSDDGDDDVCASCLLGPEEECGDWLGKCGDGLLCNYGSVFACTGKCVLEADFNSRKEGEKCGSFDGQCANDLKCRVDSDPFAFFTGGESGVCVTVEQFNSRDLGQTCGESAGTCREGLECQPGFCPWEQPTCQSPRDDKPEEVDPVPGMLEKLFSLKKNPEKAENRTEHDQVVDELMPDFIREEMAILEKILDSEIGKLNETTPGETIEIVEISENGDKPFVVTMELMNGVHDEMNSKSDDDNEDEENTSDDLQSDANQNENKITLVDVAPDADVIADDMSSTSQNKEPYVITLMDRDFKESDDFLQVFDHMSK
ncbi:unnamed protein product [Clavelina lepadiformis]|uniref:Uncharacterized protein n=1 Tax=Clavelina lepadiformis TaxID=159417 RepID=A0ABP0EYY8_CLALP